MYLKLLEDNTTVFPYNISQLYKQYPNTSFPKTLPEELLNSYNIYSVITTSPPAVDPKSHKLVQAVEKINNTWTQVWNTQPLDLEAASNNVRAYRNRLLTNSDWTQTEDSPVNKELWKIYRQALRDISIQAGFPYEVLWPTPPT